ncbi:cell division protein [Candidatus Tenderia electrophaga]|uniref:Peptidoglycan D,D-transpeptidase FtsI n=1 Tax=Candidatus Tenderia electrophaga TaxID=1748243 RepID=A0A0S2TB43_9GAMM|nr:cell division protein [Candidatus Tenderia electrophaga]
MSEWDVKLNAARRWLLLGVLLLAAAVLAWRAVYLQWIERDFLQGQGDARALRTVELAANRGVIMDRNGEPLAISTPVDSVWVNPQLYLGNQGAAKAEPLAQLLQMDAAELQQRVAERAGREFVYLKRHVSPELANKVTRLKVPGVALQREYRRYYPMAEVTGHVVGFTDIDDRGQEGMELALDERLRGIKGGKRVLKNNMGDVVEDVESIAEPQPGEDMVLSIDRRLQYLAYRELKAAVQTNRARSAAAVILDVHSGEVLAMVNQPSFNPNNRASFESANYRNRAVTDVFEPGSTMKPFTVAAALELGTITPTTTVNTAPGYLRVGSNTIRDAVNYGEIDITKILQKSSNIGATKIALSMSAEQLWKALDRNGFGLSSGSRFPGEADGRIGDYWRWSPVQQASRAYGYGIQVTALQLARAYAVLANDGLLKPISFLRLDAAPQGERVMSADVAAQVRRMLESVISDEGTGRLAKVDGYRIAGKTGTVHRAGRGGYAEDRYAALFAGIAPASRPRLAMVVVVQDPMLGDYHGGQVAAPLFAKVMSGALRLLNIAPDDLQPTQQRHAANRNQAVQASGDVL